MRRPAAIGLAVLAGAAALGSAAVLATLSARQAGAPGLDRAAQADRASLEEAAARDAAAPHLSRARALLDDGDYPAAAAALDRALEAHAGNVEALGLQVRALRLMRQYTAARAVARRLLEVTPRSALPYVLMAATSLQEGDAPSARLELERALEIDPASPLALGQMAVLDEMEGRTASARQLATKALSLDAGHGAALRVLAAQTRAVPDLIGIYERLLEDNPGDLVARAWMEALRRSGVEEVNQLAAPQSEITIPLAADADGRLAVAARLTAGGRSADVTLLIDTGGSGLVIAESLARRLGLPLDEFVESAGLGGATRHAHPVIVQDLRFPDAPALRARALMATASDFGAGYDGILNPLLLAPPGSGRILELRLTRQEMSILPARRSEQPAGRAWVTVPFLSDGLHPIFSLLVAERPARALLDTGAGADLIDRGLTRWLPRLETAPGSPGRQMLMGFAGEIAAAQRAPAVPLRLAGVNFTADPAWVVDLNAPSFRFRVDLGAVVGIGSLRRFDIRVDRSAGRISFRSLS